MEVYISMCTYIVFMAQGLNGQNKKCPLKKKWNIYWRLGVCRAGRLCNVES